MSNYERREPKLHDFYKELNISYLASDRRVMIELEKREKDAILSGDIKGQKFVQLAREYIGKDSQTRKIYDNYLKRHGVKFPLTKKEKKRKLIRNSIIGGTIIAVGLTGAILTTNYIKNDNERNMKSNVCVEYEVEQGITNTDLEDMFYEYGYASYAVSGAERNLSPNKGNPFIGDVIVGRTTKEEAEKLVENHDATIISYEEAISLLKNNNSLNGEFKKAADGDSNFVWCVVEKAKTV